MELLLISGYTAICIAVFTILRIPLNRWTVPTASVGGLVLTFALIQLLNYYHPYSGMSRPYLTTTPVTPSVTELVAEVPVTVEEHNLVAWFHQNSLLRLNDGSAAEVTFDSIPGKVFSGRVRMVMPTSNDGQALDQNNVFEPPPKASQPRIPVLINITDPRYGIYVSQFPGGSPAQAAIYGEEFHHLAVVRKTLLRMSAWMNYLSLLS
jgi:multidrug resistance efflux pump